jgi:hypothetical protein
MGREPKDLKGAWQMGRKKRLKVGRKSQDPQEGIEDEQESLEDGQEAT